MSPRHRAPKIYERVELTARAVSLSVEVATLSLYISLTLRYWYDHATNPVAYAGVCLAILTDLVEVSTLFVLDRPSWPQARLAWVMLGDVLSAILLFSSWAWVSLRGMFWQGTISYRGETYFVQYAGGDYPDQLVVQASWILPIVIGAMHLALIAIYAAPYIKANVERSQP